MNIGTDEHVFLAADSYKDRSEYIGKDPVKIGGIDYQILDIKTSSITGYQGTVYRRVDTGEVVIAHRGTEFDREPIKDGLIADSHMVLTGFNTQAREAEAFTRHAIELARQASERDGKPLHITVTGHSLGGTLAELTAYKFHLHGETFNAYGAAGLLHGVPQGGTQIINHVRAADVVSAASKHFGEVRIYATSQEIDRLSRARYRDNGSPRMRDLVHAIDPHAHGIANFLPDAQGHSALDLENTVRYRAHHTMVDRFRQDVLTARTAVSAQWEVKNAAHQLAFEAGQMMTMESVARLLETFDRARDAALNTGHFIGRAHNQARDAMARSTQAMYDGMGYLSQSFNELSERHDVKLPAAMAPSPTSPQAVQPLTQDSTELPQWQEHTRLHEQEQPAREREIATTHSVDVSSITPHSSIDAMFDALYQACIAQDHAAISRVSQAYLQSPDGQDFLQQGKDYNQQLEMHQAIQQQTVRRGPSIGR